MVPSASAAVALIVTLAGAVNVALLAGDVILTVGAMFVAGFTTIFIIDEVVTAPELSVALAVRL